MPSKHKALGGLRVDARLRDALEAEAAALGVTGAEIQRRALKAYLGVTDEPLQFDIQVADLVNRLFDERVAAFLSSQSEQSVA